MRSTHKETTKPVNEDIDSHVQKFLVGVMAITLAMLTSTFAGDPLIASISESYWRPGWAQTIFLGFLFAIAAFLFAYNGLSTLQMVMSKIASVAAICVALFPCDCDCVGRSAEAVKHGLPPIKCDIALNPHFIAAGVMFATLVFFCCTFYKRSLVPKPGRKTISTKAKYRSYIYAACAMVIVGVIVAVVLDWAFTDKATNTGLFVAKCQRFTFWAEATGLTAFGIAWLVASRTLPLITADFERYSLNPYVRQKEE